MTLGNLKLFDVDRFFGFEMDLVFEEITFSEIVLVATKDLWESIKDFEVLVDVFFGSINVGVLADEVPDVVGRLFAKHGDGNVRRNGLIDGREVHRIDWLRGADYFVGLQVPGGQRGVVDFKMGFTILINLDQSGSSLYPGSLWDLDLGQETKI